MDFPSTYGLSLSPMTQERGTYSSSNLERLVDLSTHDGKGHTLKELATNVRFECDAWDVCACTHTNIHVLVLTDSILFIFPGCKFRSMLANRQYPGNFINRITITLSALTQTA